MKGDKTMTRGEYDQNRDRIISQKRSLAMQVRQWKNRRPGYAIELQAKLDAIQTPARLPKVYGFELSQPDGTYAGFTLDEAEAKESGLTVQRREAVITSRLPV